MNQIYTDDQIAKLSAWLDAESAISRAYHKKRDILKLSNKICKIYNRHLDKLYFVWFFLTAESVTDGFKQINEFISDIRGYSD